uniref:Uncharacterized protein n=1 Tax=Anguilla anguilla TaxID=7936 RepID=A0A0E9WD32_ANGAN
MTMCPTRHLTCDHFQCLIYRLQFITYKIVN